MKKNDYVKQLIGKPAFEYQKFNELIKIKKMTAEDANLDPSKWPIEWKTIYYKSYGRFDEVVLPKPVPSKITLHNALGKRRSARTFSNQPVSLNKISNLLYYSAGISERKSEIATRFYPSPGARYPLEVYLLSLNTELPMGLYHYYVKNNSLERLFKFKKKELSKITTIPWVKTSGFLIFISAVFKRNTIKYRDRGYRMLLQEAGHMAQNFYLNSAAQNLGICAIGGFVDDGVNSMLELDGLDESVIYTLVVGEK